MTLDNNDERMKIYRQEKSKLIKRYNQALSESLDFLENSSRAKIEIYYKKERRINNLLYHKKTNLEELTKKQAFKMKGGGYQSIAKEYRRLMYKHKAFAYLMAITNLIDEDNYSLHEILDIVKDSTFDRMKTYVDEPTFKSLYNILMSE